jgi:methionyl-tRNA formyltransferase
MRVLFIGTGGIGRPTLQALQTSPAHQLVGVVTQPDKPAGRARKMQAPAIKEALDGTDVPILQPARIKDAASIEQIRAFNPDAIVVMAYGQILPRELLELPRLACLNLHASLLPRWRGAAPIQAAIAAGDPESGITVMYMAEGLDIGDILLQHKTDILPGDTGGSLHDRLGEIAPHALMESLNLVSAGSPPRIPQDNAHASYAPKLDRNMGRIDWSEAAEAIERKIRAWNPWPGAFTSVTEKSGKPRNLKIHSATVVNRAGAPGEIVRDDEGGLIIMAGSRALALQEVQLEGKRRMPATEFARGYDVASASCG